MEYPSKVKEYQLWAISEGLCHQCVNPTCKGICSCGGCGNEKYIDKIDEARKLMRKAEIKDFKKHIKAIKKRNEETK